MLAKNCYRVFCVADGDLTQSLVATPITEQVFSVIVGDLTKVFGSYANYLISFWHRCQIRYGLV